MIVKICGITNREDALESVESGARAIGFNFYPKSPRYVTPDAAAEIGATLPEGVLKVGVFVNESPAAVAAIREAAGLDVVQLHGDETANGWQGERVWKAFAVRNGFTAQQLDAFPAEAYVLDAPADGIYGGSGHTFDWSLAHELRQRIVLAGGLDASNVRQAIAAVRPWAVDACSRIERAPGRKDHARLRQFIQTALSESL